LSTHLDLDIQLKTITRNANKICILFYYLYRLVKFYKTSKYIYTIHRTQLDKIY
jgi:hypothetical protein